MHDPIFLWALAWVEGVYVHELHNTSIFCSMNHSIAGHVGKRQRGVER